MTFLPQFSFPAFAIAPAILSAILSLKITSFIVTSELGAIFENYGLAKSHYTSETGQ